MLSPFLYRHSTTHSFNSIIKVAEDTTIISLITKVSMEYREEQLQRRTRERIIGSCTVEDTTPSPSTWQQWQESAPPGSFQLTSPRIWPGLQQNNKQQNSSSSSTEEQWDTRAYRVFCKIYRCNIESILSGCITARYGRNSLYMRVW